MTVDDAKKLKKGDTVWYGDFVVGKGPVIKQMKFSHTEAPRITNNETWTPIELHDGGWYDAKNLHHSEVQARRSVAANIQVRIYKLEEILYAWENPS